MIIKRIPLFIVGFLYGAVINGVVLGLCYGICTIALILQVCFANGGIPITSLSANAAGFVLAALTAIVAGGLAVGVVYGVFAGAWHCAMDFYNNGFLQGLSSPFRCISAHLSENPNKLKEYYHSTDVNFLTRKQAVQHRAEAIHTTMDEIAGTKVKAFPKSISKIIAGYEAMSPEEIETPGVIKAVSNVIENVVLSSDEKKSSPGEKQSFPNTAASFFTPEEVVNIIDKHHFFSESKRGPSQVTRAPTASAPSPDDYPVILGGPD